MVTKPTNVTQKGQVTIPVAVREKLGLNKGDQVTFIVTARKEVKLKAIKRPSIMDLYGSLKPKVRPNLSGQELIKWESEQAHQAWAEEADKQSLLLRNK